MNLEYLITPIHKLQIMIALLIATSRGTCGPLKSYSEVFRVARRRLYFQPCSAFETLLMNAYSTEIVRLLP